MSRRIWSFVVGGLMGAAIGVLYAPRSGKESREQLSAWADEYVEQGREGLENQRDRVLKAVDNGREVVYQKSEELKAKIDEAKERLKEQVDMASESAREKVSEAISKAREMTDRSDKEQEEAN